MSGKIFGVSIAVILAAVAGYMVARTNIVDKLMNAGA